MAGQELDAVGTRSGSVQMAWMATWRESVQNHGPEHDAALAAVLQRAQRLEARTPEAALPLLLAEYEMELQRVLARLSWLEMDANPIPVGTRERTPDPAGWYRVPAHAPEDDLEDEAEEEEAQEALRSRMK